MSKIGTNTGSRGFLGNGIYLATNKNDAKQYGSIVKELYINSKKPLDLRNKSYSDVSKLLPNLKMKNGIKWSEAFKIKDSLDKEIKYIEKDDLGGGFFNIYYEYNDKDYKINRRSESQVSNDKDTMNLIKRHLLPKIGIDDPDNIGALGNYFGSKLKNEVLENGYDSVFSKGTNFTDVGDEIVVFDPNQIKSVDAESFCHETNINKSLKII